MNVFKVAAGIGIGAGAFLAAPVLGGVGVIVVGGLALTEAAGVVVAAGGAAAAADKHFSRSDAEKLTSAKRKLAEYKSKLSSARADGDADAVAKYGKKVNEYKAKVAKYSA